MRTACNDAQRVILDDGGWTLTPGLRMGLAPRPTDDRLRTALSLARESDLLHSQLATAP